MRDEIYIFQDIKMIGTHITRLNHDRCLKPV